MLDRLSNTGASSKASGATGPLGTLYLTATHLIFVDHEGKRETWILHSLLCHLEKVISYARRPGSTNWIVDAVVYINSWHATEHSMQKFPFAYVCYSER